MDGTVAPLARYSMLWMRSSLQATYIWSSTRRTQRGYMGLEVAGWSRCSGRRTACLPGCVHSARRSQRQVVRAPSICQYEPSLAASSIPAHILTLPARLQQQQQQPSVAQPLTPIIPLLTPRARALSARLLAHGLNARPISWPTVPKGMVRVRVCLHAGNTQAEIDALINASIAWAAGIAQDERLWPEGDRTRIEEGVGGIGLSG
jgi:hypothetical protein